MCKHSAVSSFNIVIGLLKNKDSIDLDTEQTIAYKVICSTFLLKVLDENKPVDETETGDSHEAKDTVRKVLNAKPQSKKADLDKHLHVFWGRKQLLMFITGPAGTGKSTAIKAAKVFCQQFCKVANILLMVTNYMYTD